jgi:hypothetical protein
MGGDGEKKEVAVLEGGRYLAVVVDGKVHLYKKSAAQLNW